MQKLTPAPPVALLRESFLHHDHAVPLEELKQLRDFFVRLVELRTEEEELVASLATSSTSATTAPVSPVQPFPVTTTEQPTAAPQPAVEEPLARKPMRPPRPGTTRAMIYGLLSEQGGQPLRRAEIVDEVARLRGEPAEQTLKSVAAVLKDRHDPHIVRLGHGEYAFQAGAGNATSA